MPIYFDNVNMVSALTNGTIFAGALDGTHKYGGLLAFVRDYILKNSTELKNAGNN